jgi:Flp pilus assembly protein TadG
MKQHGKSRRGSLMVESALILLVFMTVLVGTFDISQLLFVQQSITERVRVAARYGAVNPYDQAAIENMVLYSQSTVPATGNAAFNLTRSMVTVVRSDAGTPEDRISVTVSNFPFEFITPMIAGVAQGIAIKASASYELL